MSVEFPKPKIEKLPEFAQNILLNSSSLSDDLLVDCTNDIAISNERKEQILEFETTLYSSDPIPENAELQAKKFKQRLLGFDNLTEYDNYVAAVDRILKNRKIGLKDDASSLEVYTYHKDLLDSQKREQVLAIEARRYRYRTIE